MFTVAVREEVRYSALGGKVMFLHLIALLFPAYTWVSFILEFESLSTGVNYAYILKVSTLNS